VLTEDDCRPAESYPCIKCGHCIDACPVFINPQLLGSLALVERYEEMEDCPSNIPLSQLFQAAKAALRKSKAA